MYENEILHQRGERVKTKSQKVLKAKSYVCRSYRGKTGRGFFLPLPPPVILNRVQATYVNLCQFHFFQKIYFIMNVLLDSFYNFQIYAGFYDALFLTFAYFYLHYHHVLSNYNFLLLMRQTLSWFLHQFIIHQSNYFFIFFFWQWSNS